MNDYGKENVIYEDKKCGAIIRARWDVREPQFFKN